ncbi:site-specific DNA-methyltransferase [Enterobacter sp. RHBSTW-00994]|uniref:site-specific DNA-methyltransferase n=1 Tax=Enterobacter sp. RHBSTW-00994 TaxID=2742676 RepID=UPI0015E9F7A8|nr:site-specific DNA-methyltransferase [Enterobacter sp. RHBSTW-00994]QLR41651.1 site-specific DNA-methyltransferase [Enterobacter sp. RHBSTW-00994]
MDKLKMHSPNLVEQNIDKLAALFPNCVTESKDEHGKLKQAIDFDLLKQELSRHIVDGPQERYQLNWPGKREALLTANAPIAKTLRPYREESVNFDTTRNLFIEGDNLDALKLLQETYLGKVKMIYIDPPYNTGKDFIYEDDFAVETDEYLKFSNQKDEIGNRLTSNTEANGRMHSDWLSMMYSRLKLAHGFLHDSGAIFISIHHKEVANLRKIADEIFGEKNLLCMFAWRTDGNFDNQAKFKYCHEYVLAYAKSEPSFLHPLVVDPNTPEGSKIFRPEIRNTIVKNGPKNPPSLITLPKGFPVSFEEGVIRKKDDSWPHILSDINVSNHKITTEVQFYSGWSSKELLEDFINNGCQAINDAKGQETIFEITATGAIEAIKLRGKPSHVISMLAGFGGSQKASAELQDIGVVFDDYPKPTSLIKYFASMINCNDFVIMDFFAGSGTTAQAVIKLNSEDGGNRRYILVQLPEPCHEKSEAYKSGYKTISEISLQRLRLSGKSILDENYNCQWNKDIGFRVLKIDTSNMSDIYYAPDAVTQDDLFDQVENVKSDRSEEDLLFQVMLDWGVDLTLPIHCETIADKKVFFVDAQPDNSHGALVACFDKTGGIDEDFIKQLAAFSPLRLVFRDAGFASDAAKTNAEQLLKQLSATTDVKTI